MNHQSILILFAHPAFQKSRVNKILIQAVRDLEWVTVHDLYELYPDFYIDVLKEQETLLNHEIVIFQFPFLWYSLPSLLKEWEDIVLQHGWAYGSKGHKLRHKKFFCTITTGGIERAYQKGRNSYTIRQLLAPIEKSASLCEMEYFPPFAVHGTHFLEKDDIQKYGERYRRLLFALIHHEIDFQKLGRIENLNSHLDFITSD